LLRVVHVCGGVHVAVRSRSLAQRGVRPTNPPDMIAAETASRTTHNMVRWPLALSCVLGKTFEQE
jgi:hypothetical protein